MKKKLFYTFLSILFLTSCADSFDSVKRGLTGAKRQSADEFLIKKKDPLVLPPDFESLPDPSGEIDDQEEISIFENTIETSIEENSDTSDSVEQSILKKIQSK